MKKKTKKKPNRPNQWEQRLNPKPQRTKRKKDNIDLICEEIKRYNEEHETAYSYGEYTALVRAGKIKSQYRNKRNFTIVC